MTYRLGIDVRARSTDWVALGRKGDVAAPLATGTADSAVAFVDGELRAGSAAVATGVAHSTTDFIQRLGDAEPMMIEGTPYGVESLIGHLVASVVSDAEGKVGSAPGAVVLVHDDNLDDYRRGLWAEAGRLAGIPLAGLTLVSRSEALALRVGKGDGAAAAGAAKIGWERHPDEPGAESSALTGGKIAGAAVAGGAVVGGGILGATIIGGGQAIAGGPTVAAGPAGTPLSAVGPSGTPLSVPAGPAGTSLSGPTGTSLAGPGGPTGTPLSGPTGTPLQTVAKLGKRSLRIPIIAGAIVAVGLGVVVVAASGDDPKTAPSTTVVVVTTDSVADSVADSVLVPTDVGAAPACVVGSWVVDNDSFAQHWLALVGTLGLAATVDSVTGVVAVDVDADGVWTITYTDWGFTSGFNSAGSQLALTLSITGVDKSTGNFLPDGSFTFLASDASSVITMSATAGGASVPMPSLTGAGSAFGGTGTYACDDATMTINIDGNPGPIVMNRPA